MILSPWTLLILKEIKDLRCQRGTLVWFIYRRVGLLLRAHGSVSSKVLESMHGGCNAYTIGCLVRPQRGMPVNW